MRIFTASGLVIGMGLSPIALSGTEDGAPAPTGRCDAVALRAEKVMLGRQAKLPPATIESEDEKIDSSERAKALRNNLMTTSAFYPIETSPNAKAAAARKFGDYYKEDCLVRNRWSEE